MKNVGKNLVNTVHENCIKIVTISGHKKLLVLRGDLFRIAYYRNAYLSKSRRYYYRTRVFKLVARRSPTVDYGRRRLRERTRTEEKSKEKG